MSYQELLNHGILEESHQKELIGFAQEPCVCATHYTPPHPCVPCKSKSEIILHNMKLVRMVAIPYARRLEVDPDELMSEGVIAIHEAIDDFDLSVGCNFYPFLKNRIDWKFKKMMDECFSYSISNDMLNRTHEVKAKLVEYERQGKNFDVIEVAKELGIKRSRVMSILGLLENTNARQEDEIHDGNIPVSKSREDHWMIDTDLSYFLGTLNERDHYILCARYGIGMPEKTAKELAKELGVTMATIHNILKRVIWKLQEQAGVSEEVRLEFKKAKRIF